MKSRSLSPRDAAAGFQPIFDGKSLNGWTAIRLFGERSMVHSSVRAMQIFNRAVSSIVSDDDTRNRVALWIDRFQMHVGEPMKIEFRNIGLKQD